MNKAGKFLLSVLLCLGFMLPAAAHADPEYVLSLNLPIPPIHTRWQGPLKAWVEEVEKRSGGRLKIEPYFAEALSPRAEAFESVKSGIADITECAYEANFGQFPFHEGILSISSPELYLADGTALVKGMYAVYPQVLRELEGVKLLFTHASGSLTIGTTNKPIRTLEDLKGLKINANSAMIAERLKRLGVTVVSLSLSDLYSAMEQGVIEGTTLAPELLVSRRYGDCLKYLTDLSVQNTLFYVVINEDVYNGLPEDLRKILDEVSGDFADRAFMKYWEAADTDAIKKWRADMGGKEFILLSDADYAKARELMQPPVDAWFDSLTQKGLPGADMKKTFYELEHKLGIPWKDSLIQKTWLETLK
ncbi:TRAP transporter substrate-binding protein [uncultured Mailhella sp.]|uniref:TRAP transporter substrate-binding protein n=1 Tax=uncultured Mailhella sp. TaxID=1981031 RepID=UPI0026320900|nr:TRAP transporter substrate-binding protein [uncultured Mailhella sp.]